MSKIVDDIRMARLESGGTLIVAAFRDGHRDDFCFRGGELFDGGLAIVRSEEEICDRADDASAVAIDTALNQRVKPIL